MRPLIACLCGFTLLCGASSAAASNLDYYGGPIVHSAKGVVVEWGPGVNSVFTNTTSGVPGMLSYFAQQSGSTSDLGAVLAQYMDTGSDNSANAVSYGGDYKLTLSNTSTTLQDSDIQAELTSQIAAGHLPAPTGPSGLGTIYLLLFPKTITECLQGTCDGQSGGFCAYHGSASLNGTNVLYAVLPSDEPGTGNYSACGSDPSYLNNFTAYTAHEWGETINDPLVANAPDWGPPLGWYDPTYNGEIADKCDAQPLASNGSFTVEPLWSNADGNCVAGEDSTFSQPIASFTVGANPTPGQPLGFDAGGSADGAGDHTSAAYSNSSYSLGPGIASYDWNWGDGATDGTGATPTHAYADPGNYTVTLTVTDDLGFSGVTSQSVVVGTPMAAVTTGSADALSEQGATLHGTINTYGNSANYRFVYGTSQGALTSSTPTGPAPTGDTATPVSATVTSGLNPSTTYYYRLEALVNGQTVPGQIQQFTTNAAPPPPQTPVAGTGGATMQGRTSAILNGTIDAGGPASVTYRFAYGSSPSGLTQLTPALAGPSGTTSVPVSATITGLSVHTTYYFRLYVGLAGKLYPGAVHSFTTPAPRPAASTGAAHVHGTSAALVGTVNPHGVSTKYYFKLGRRSSYGLSSNMLTAGSGNAARTASAVVSGLRPHTRYHYRLVAINAGGSAAGSDKTFVTGAAANHARRLALDVKPGQRLGRALTSGLRVTFACASACRASFSAFVAPSGILRGVVLPVTVARGSGVAHRAGLSWATLRFSRDSQRRLRSRRSLRLLISGYATAADGSLSAPSSSLVTFRR